MGVTGNIPELLEKALATRDLTLAELVKTTGELLSRVAPRQTRYKVTERPDVRTIRYYISQKLLPRPDSYQGGKARFSGRHLLRLLVIKKLQAEHQTLRQIGRVLEQSDARLHELLVGGQEPSLQLAPVGRKDRNEADRGEADRGEAHRDNAETELSGSTIIRVPLHGGANLDLPRNVARDLDSRHELANQLEQLARKLRNAGEDR